jgi:prepilin-type N-terminal cleavage/methylation domain-containing protein
MKAGFSLVEMTIAVAIVLAVTGAVFALMDPAHGVFRAQPEAIDQQQRIRVAADAITRELQSAGAGVQMFFAPVLPYRRGASGADPPGTFSPVRVSTVSIPAAAAQTFVTLATDGGNAVYVQARGGCPASDPLCGFAPNMTVVIFDESGSFDTFRISAVQAQPPALLRASGALSKSYPAGAIIAQAAVSTLWARSTAGAGELMRYDGAATDLPLVDDLTALGFEYYGDPAPPVLRRPLSDPDGPWTSYGPKPPEAGIDDPETPSYGPGENCLFTVIDGATVGRPEMAQLGAGSALVLLDERRLSDGPWCPDPAAPNRFDADLLRVRRVRVTFHVRGTPIVFDVAPRNLILRR